MLMGVLYEDVKNNGVPLHVCAPYGTDKLEVAILDGVKPASGETG